MTEQKVVVVGAGFSGLVAAYALVKKGIVPEIYEAKSRAGGLIGTESCSYGLREWAANGLLYTPSVDLLFKDLDLDAIGCSKRGRRRFIFAQSMRRWPLGLGETIGLLWRFLMGRLRRSKLKPQPRESVDEWARRCLGQAMAEKIVAPALLGVYAQSSKSLSASLILGGLTNKQSEKRKSPEKAKLRFRGTVAPRLGMQDLIDQLVSWLEAQGVRIHFGQPYEHTSDEILVLTGSPVQMASVVQEQRPPLAERLRKIEMAPVATVYAAFKNKQAEPGFGCLFSETSGIRALGVLWENAVFAERPNPNEIWWERWIYGGHRFSSVIDLSDEKLKAQVLEDREAMGMEPCEPKDYFVRRIPQALPLYGLKLEEILEDGLDEKPYYFVSNYKGRIGLAKILDTAFETAEIIVEQNPLLSKE